MKREFNLSAQTKTFIDRCFAVEGNGK